MARRSKRSEPEKLRSELVDLLVNFEDELQRNNLRNQVLGLMPAHHLLRDLGSSLITEEGANSARDRILSYFQKYPKNILYSEELMIVAGISEYARRIRELRVEMGWPILTGHAIKDMLNAGENFDDFREVSELKKDTYVLLSRNQDREAAFRWNLANEIRKSKVSVKDKILSYLRKNVGKAVTGEELRYLAKDKSEWARRVRELRTEDGWPVSSKNTGRPDLNIGEYVLEEDRQAEIHDRKISDAVRIKVLERDNFTCVSCGWNLSNRRKEDKYRNLIELHHIQHHVDGGKNEVRNLVSLCNVCHDEVHRANISSYSLIDAIKPQQ